MAWFLALALLLLAGCGADRSTPPNVVFISIDDMNDWVSVINDPRRHKPIIPTPHIEQLAARGVAFWNAHTPIPLCAPTRASIMAGLYPGLDDMFIDEYERNVGFHGIRTITQHFMDHGYVALGAGKIYPPLADPAAYWDEYQPFAIPDDQLRPAQGRGGARPPKALSGLPSISAFFDWGIVDLPEDQLNDVQVADWAVEALEREFDRPFFLGVGFHLPHPPWYLPRALVEDVNLEKMRLPKVADDDLDDIPAIAREMAWWRPWVSHGSFATSDHARILQAGLWEQAVRFYATANRLIDTQVGRILDALSNGPYADNTIVVLWSDHGWHLGEKQHWRKSTLWEEATRVPLVLHSPGLTETGLRPKAPVSLVDLYPTLVELAGLPLPQHRLDGRSLTDSLIETPDALARSVLTLYGTGNAAVRTRDWRYIRYSDGSEELYDHRSDPLEWKNLAKFDAHQPRRTDMAALLRSLTTGGTPSGSP